MALITITEALAEIKAIDNKVAKKSRTVLENCARSSKLADPFEKDGGQAKVVKQEMQSIEDLYIRKVALRRGIQKINNQVEVSVNNRTMTIGDWLAWRKDVAAIQLMNLENLANVVKQSKSSFVKNARGTEEAPETLIVNINEKALMQEIEDIHGMLDSLDGQLSLKNATVTFEI